MAWAVGWSWAGRIATGLECLREDRVEVGLLGPGIPGNSSSDGEGGSKSTATRHVHQSPADMGYCSGVLRTSASVSDLIQAGSDARELSRLLNTHGSRRVNKIRI
jgi:hypothetical protein